MTWRRATDRGDALRIGHGTYCLATAWFRWPPWDRRPPHHLYPGTGPVLQTYRRHLESTGQAFTGRFPVPPGIRKQWTRGTLAPV